MKKLYMRCLVKKEPMKNIIAEMNKIDNEFDRETVGLNIQWTRKPY